MAKYRDYASIQKAMCLNKGDIIRFEKIDCTLSVRSSYLSDTADRPNKYIFEKLNITNPQAFCSVAYGYAAGMGGCPVCRDDDYSALTQLAMALMCVYEEKFGTLKVEAPESLFKVGDVVTILSEYLPGTSKYSYQNAFTEDMLRTCRNLKCTISQIVPVTRRLNNILSHDPYTYYLREAGQSWSAEMFEETYIKSSYSAAKKVELIQESKRQRVQRYMEEEMTKVVASTNTEVTTETCSILDKVLYQSVGVKSNTKSSQKYSVLLESEIKIQINKKHYTI